MKKIFTISFTLVFLIYHECQTQNLYFPPSNSSNWEKTDPKTLSWCPDKIDNLYRFLDSTNSKAFILLKDGKIVLEKYFDNFTEDSLHVWNSAGKTLTGLAIGIAQQEGLLKISDASSLYLGKAWTSCTEEQEQKIKIIHQLSMTTGLDDDVNNPDCTTTSCFQYKADAGTRWAYHNGPYTILDKVITNATKTTLNKYIANKILSPIGGEGFYFNFQDNNVFISKAHTMARFGLLLLAKGKWNNLAILNDSNYYNAMINSSQSINPSYGLLTWLNGKSSYKVPGLQFQFQGFLNPDAPADVFAAIGKNGQLINVQPSTNIVFIRMGDAPSSNSLVPISYNNDIWKKVLNLSCPTNLDEVTDIEFDCIVNNQENLITLKALTDSEIINHFSLIDMSGNILKNSKINQSQFSFSTSSLPSGIYNIVLEIQNKQFSKRILITD